MKILDFDLEGSHFIIEADISPRQEADDMECQWLRYDFDNTKVYKETDGVVSPFQIKKQRAFADKVKIGCLTQNLSILGELIFLAQSAARIQFVLSPFAF